MLAQRLTRASLRRWPLPSATGSTSKEDRGRVVVVGGSRSVPGAVLLAGEAALRAGAGKLMTLTAMSLSETMALVMPESAVIGVALDASGELGALETEAVARVREAAVALVGPGMATGASPASAQVARAARYVVADAGSLHADALQPAYGRLVLTPHVAEMADLLNLRPDEVAQHSAEVACEAALEFGAVVILKGPTSWIATPDGALWRHDVAAPGLGTSGSGDVLAGVVAGLIARGATLAQAACWAVMVHARAGVAASRQVAPIGFLARELLPRIPGVLARLEAH
ncbi:NAD(P)H-hydrate dehydratase [Luteibacter sp.]|uniref:NAD(P)H-hydrate dehydratase n=1 Tax=Luteibacter sp. TaxID=1886636 RepID=UPI003F7E8A50